MPDIDLVWDTVAVNLPHYASPVYPFSFPIYPLISGPSICTTCRNHFNTCSVSVNAFIPEARPNTMMSLFGLAGIVLTIAAPPHSVPIHPMKPPDFKMLCLRGMWSPPFELYLCLHPTFLKSCDLYKTTKRRPILSPYLGSCYSKISLDLQHLKYKTQAPPKIPLPSLNLTVCVNVSEWLDGAASTERT